LSGGQAQLTVDNLAAGKYTIQARYLGTANHLASASAAIQQSVKGGGK
jgi:Bacterial Ig-like domain (group 3)